MSTTDPFDPAQPHGGATPSAMATPPAAQEQPRSAGGPGRTVALVGGLLGIVAVAAGGAYAFSSVSGGGAQPESVLPASTVAFVKVDLDPSAGQKLDALRFLRRFPELRATVGEDADLRKVVFDGLREDGELEGVDYARDVEPWLGQRVAVGLVPGATAKEEPTPVLVLAVEDRDAAAASLPKLAGSLEGACQVLEEYAVCGEDSSRAQLSSVVAAGEKASLADADGFRADLDALGEDGVAAAWVDLAKAGELASAFSPGTLTGLTDPGAAARGRVAAALRFDGTTLELAGRATGTGTSWAGSGTAGSVVDLPEGTLAAVTVANAGEQLRAAWPRIEEAAVKAAGQEEYAQGLAEVEDTLGISVPDDLAKALGSQLSLAFAGIGEGEAPESLEVGVVTDGDRAVLRTLVDGGAQAGFGLDLVTEEAGDRTVLSPSQAYADRLAAARGGLGGSAAFRAAVPDLDGARVVLFADVAGLVAELGDDVSDEYTKPLAPLSAFGATVSGSGDEARFTLRLTTK